MSSSKFSRKTALCEACFLGNYEDKEMKLIKFLIKNGADINALDYFKNPPLYFAIETQYSNLDVIKLLIEGGADINYQYNDGKYIDEKIIFDLEKQNLKGSDIVRKKINYIKELREKRMLNKSIK